MPSRHTFSFRHSSTRLLIHRMLLVGTLSNLFAAQADATTEELFKLPTPPLGDKLISEYPFSKCELTSLTLIAKCKADLEAYRHSFMEPYNRSVNDYIDALKAADRHNRRLRKANKITQDDYDDNHDQLDLEFKKTAKAGSYMLAYYDRRDQFSQDQKTLEVRRKALVGLCGTKISDCS